MDVRRGEKEAGGRSKIASLPRRMVGGLVRFAFMVTPTLGRGCSVAGETTEWAEQGTQESLLLKVTFALEHLRFSLGLFAEVRNNEAWVLLLQRLVTALCEGRAFT